MHLERPLLTPTNYFSFIGVFPLFFSNKIWAIFCSSLLSNIIEVKFLMFMKVHHFVFHFLIGFILFFMFRSILSYNIIVSDEWFTATREDVCRFEVLCIVMGEYNFVGFDHHDAICVITKVNNWWCSRYVIMSIFFWKWKLAGR